MREIEAPRRHFCGRPPCERHDGEGTERSHWTPGTRLRTPPPAKSRRGRAARLALLRPCLYKRMFVPWAVTGETASSTPGSYPTPNPTRAPASCGGNQRQLLVRLLGHVSPAAPSCSRRRVSGSRTSASRTRPASHPSPPSAASTRSRRRRSLPTKYGQPGSPPRQTGRTERTSPQLPCRSLHERPHLFDRFRGVGADRSGTPSSGHVGAGPDDEGLLRAAWRRG